MSFVFAVSGNSLPIVLSLLHNLGSHPTVFFWGAALAVLAPVFVVLFPSRWRPLRWAFQYGGVVGLTMMQAYSGGPSSPYALLLVMPAIWFGATVTGGELWAAVALLFGCCFAPMAVIGAPAYQADVLAALMLATITSTVLASLAVFTRETSRLTDRLSHEATHDRLTGLLNRRGWEDATEQAMSNADPEVAVCVLLIDLDGLKLINDTAGHDQGDRLIRETGGRLGAVFAAEAAAARLGGDEFAVLFLESPADQVMRRVEQVRGSTPPEGVFSAGIAVLAPLEQLGDTMRRADLALYEVKKTGRGRTLLASAPPDLNAENNPGRAAVPNGPAIATNMSADRDPAAIHSTTLPGTS